MIRQSRAVSRPSVALLLVGLIGSLLVGGWATAPGAHADFKPHPTLVPDVPAGGYPAILKTPMLIEGGTPNYNVPESREVFAADQIGRAIVSGGNFQEIRLQDGTVIQQHYFAAWNIDTKQMICQQKFIFNNDVLEVAPGPRAGTVYVGGRFTKITGADGVERNRSRIALINLDTCQVETAFNAGGVNAKVSDIVYANNRLFIGGDFTIVGDSPIETIAEIDPLTGAVNPAFNFVTSNELTSRVKAMGVNPGGTRLIIAGRWMNMTGPGGSLTGSPTAVINISNPAAPTLTGHRSSGTVTIGDLQDASVSPDGTAVGLAFGTATVSDYIYLIPTTETAVTPRWVHYMRDSSFGIGISNNAVYVAGHFCKPDSGPSASDVMAPAMGLDTCTGSTRYSGGVWRSHLAALSLTDGTPLTWNPGQGSHTGGREITITTRGILVGYDGERTAGRDVGALAFFDLGAGVEDVTPPGPVTFTSPTPGQALNNPALLTGRADDDFGVASYKVAVKSADGRWVQSDGTLGANRQDITVAPDQDGSFELSLTMPAGNYTAYARALDGAGLRSATDTTVNFVETGIEGIRPESTVVVPTGTLLTETDLKITGTATDNVAVASLVAHVTTPAGKYVQADGTIANTAANLPVTITGGALNSPSATWSLDIPKTLPANTYTVEIVAKDPSGNIGTSTGSFDLKPNAPVVATSSPVSPAISDEPFNIAGTATDDTLVASVKVQVKNAAGDFLHTDGTFGAAQVLPATVTGLGTASTAYQYNAGLLPIGAYQVIATATDGVGNTTTKTTDVNVTDVLEVKSPLITGYTGFTTSSGNFTIGYTFKVAQQTKLSAVGLFDADKDGVNDNTSDVPFGIWRDGNTNPVAQGTIPRGAASENGWFYGNLATPLTLDPTVTYVVGILHTTSGEKYGGGGTVAKDANLTMVASAYASSSTLAYPSTRAGATWYGVPNLKTVTTVSTKPQVAISSPKASILNEEAFVISGTATDNSQVASLSIQVKNAAGEYLRADGSFGAAQDLPATVSGLGTASAAYQYGAGLLPIGDYQVIVTAKDGAANTTVATKDVKVTDTSETTRPLLTGYSGYTALAGDYTMGYSFTVSQETKISAIGFLDTDKDGVNDNPAGTAAGIWTQNVTTPLATTTIPKTATAEGGWFYGNLATPITLTPGITYIVATQGTSGGENLAYGGTVTKDPAITPGEMRYTTSTTLAYPGTSLGYACGGPNLKAVTGVSSKPVVKMTSPGGEVTFGQGAKVEADVTDNISVASVKARLTNAAGEYLQDDGVFGAAVNDLDATVTGAGTVSAKISVTTQALPVGTYTATVIAADGVNNVGTASRSFSVVAPPAVIPAIKGYTGFIQASGDYSLGYQFRVTRTATLSEVGIQDSNGDGVLNNATDTPYSLWRQSDRAVLATGTVAKASPSQGGWFYGKLASPVTLQPGVTYVVMYRAYAAGETYTSGGTLNQDGIFQYVGYAYGSAATPMPFPTWQGTSPVGYGMPNLRFVNPSPPVILKPADKSTEKGTAASLQLIGADPDGGTVTYSSSELPAGLSLNPSTGLISGTPTTAGTTTITATVTDDEGVQATTAFTWTVTGPVLLR